MAHVLPYQSREESQQQHRQHHRMSRRSSSVDPPLSSASHSSQQQAATGQKQHHRSSSSSNSRHYHTNSKSLRTSMPLASSSNKSSVRKQTHSRHESLDFTSSTAIPTSSSSQQIFRRVESGSGSGMVTAALHDLDHSETHPDRRKSVYHPPTTTRHPQPPHSTTISKRPPANSSSARAAPSERMPSSVSAGNSRHSQPSNSKRRSNSSSGQAHPSTNSRPPTTSSASYFPGVKMAIDELNKAIGHEKRIAAITNACVELDHWDEQRHNVELAQLNAANSLSLVLSMTDDDDEIRMICAALEMVYRASQDAVRASFFQVGAGVVPLLLRLLERCEGGTIKHADVCILNITRVLLYFSRVPELRVPLARQQGFLVCLVRVATSILNPECRILRMRVLANLANSDENKATMFEHAGLLESILKVATLDLSEGAREYASASLMDLASAVPNQLPMARNDKLLATLVKLSVVDEKAETREYAVTALQNLAFSKDHRNRLVCYGNGVVVEALKKAVSGDCNEKARRRAAGALTNLACDETAQRMGNHKGLLPALVAACVSDSNDGVQKRACLALTKIATSVTAVMSCFGPVLDALVTVASSSRRHASGGVSAVLRVMARAAENRERLVRHPGLLDTLCDMVVTDKDDFEEAGGVHDDDDFDRSKVSYSNAQQLDSTTTDSNSCGKFTAKDRENAMRALMHLTNEATNRKLMCTSKVLDALVKGALLSGGGDDRRSRGASPPTSTVTVTADDSDTRDSAIVAMERLATEVGNRQMMARHEGLIVAIAHATEREHKAEFSEDTSSSSKSSSHPARLAKPLLMSLLVAM